MFKCHLYLVKVILSEGYSSMHVATHAVMRSAPWSSYRRPVSPYTFQSVLLLSPVPCRLLICCPLIQFCLFQTVMQMEPYGTQLFESAFFCSALCFWFRSMLLHVSEVCSFLLLHTIPSSGYDLFFFFCCDFIFYICVLHYIACSLRPEMAPCSFLWTSVLTQHLDTALWVSNIWVKR